MPRLTYTGLTAFAFALLACSTPSTPSTQPNDGGVDANAIPDAGSTHASFTSLVDAFCDASRVCCGRDGFPATDLDSCESEVRRQWNLDAYESSIDAGTIELDAARIAECIAALEASATSCAWVDVESKCFGAFQGTTAVGATCSAGRECDDRTSATTCWIATDGMGEPISAGVCGANARGTVGTKCSYSCRDEICGLTSYAQTNSFDAVCYASDGLYCDYVSDTCVAFFGLGGDCTWNEQCGPTAFCSDASKCEARKPASVACAHHYECEANFACFDGSCAALTFAYEKLCSGDFD